MGWGNLLLTLTTTDYFFFFLENRDFLLLRRAIIYGKHVHSTSRQICILPLKTGVYTRTVLKLYSSLQENFTLHQGKFRAARKLQWFKYSCIATWSLFIDWHTSKHPLLTAVNHQRKWIIHESDCNGRNSSEVKSSCQSLSQQASWRIFDEDSLLSVVSHCWPCLMRSALHLHSVG